MWKYKVCWTQPNWVWFQHHTWSKPLLEWSLSEARRKSWASLCGSSKQNKTQRKEKEEKCANKYVMFERALQTSVWSQVILTTLANEKSSNWSCGGSSEEAQKHMLCMKSWFPPPVPDGLLSTTGNYFPAFVSRSITWSLLDMAPNNHKMAWNILLRVIKKS